LVSFTFRPLYTLEGAKVTNAVGSLEFLVCGRNPVVMPSELPRLLMIRVAGAVRQYRTGPAAYQSSLGVG